MISFVEMLEIFAQQFYDTATFSTISCTTTTSGQDKKVETPLYTDIRCNVFSKVRERVRSVEGQDEQFTNEYRIDVEAQYGGAERGDAVDVAGQRYLIARKDADHDFSGNICFWSYFVTETV